MGSRLANTPQTVMSIQVVAYTTGRSESITADSIQWALYLGTFNGVSIKMDMGIGPFVPDDNDATNGSRLCSIDYTPSASYTPDNLWDQIRIKSLEQYDFVRDRVGFLYWILIVFCLLEELSWVEDDTLPHLHDWASYTYSKFLDPLEVWLKQGTFDTVAGRQFAATRTATLRARLAARLEEQRNVETRLNQMKNQGQRWSKPLLETMASFMSAQLYLPLLPPQLEILINHINPAEESTLQHFHQVLKLRLQSPPVYVRSGSLIRAQLRDEIYKLLHALRQENRDIELGEYFGEQVGRAWEELSRQMYVIGTLDRSIDQAKVLLESRKVLRPMGSQYGLLR